MKVRLAPGEENRFLVQLSTDAQDSRIRFVVEAFDEVRFSTSETQQNTIVPLISRERNFTTLTDETYYRTFTEIFFGSVLGRVSTHPQR